MIHCNMKNSSFYALGILMGIMISVILTSVILLLKDSTQRYKNTKEVFNLYPNLEIKLEQPEFLLSDNPAVDLLDVLVYYEVQYPEIVYAQAVLETGHFRSKVFKECNNLFGLYDSNIGDYYKFDHWSDSVKAYKDYVQRKYNSGDYFQFLIDLPYATDPEYVNKLKQIIK